MTPLTFLLYVCFVVSCYSLNQLSFSGGGAFGAVEIGILKRVIEQGGRWYKPEYDLYTGISAGALNAGFLSYYSDIRSGVKIGESIYSNLRSHMVYSIVPSTGVSVYNTQPLYKTLSDVIDNMPGQPIVRTLIGATNMYSGNLDVYSFDDYANDEDKVYLLMSSSAIPGLFPPIPFNDQLYADGGTLSNELLQPEYLGDYLNITYITPNEGYQYDNTPITSLKDVLVRTVKILLANFNNPLALLYQGCKEPIGELNQYYVDSDLLEGYSMLDFDKGQELVSIGYNNMKHKKYVLC